MKKVLLFTTLVISALGASAFDAYTTGELKNKAGLAYYPPESPDLVISAISLGEDGASFTVTIKNIGMALIPANTIIKVKGVVSYPLNNEERISKTFVLYANQALAPDETISLVENMDKPTLLQGQTKAKKDGEKEMGEPINDLPPLRPDKKKPLGRPSRSSSTLDNTIQIKAEVSSDSVIGEYTTDNNSARETFMILE